ncbi:WD repeat-containing protein 37-like isoform X2 [Dreissena polymorpha]|uniref:WD repeat-containing protein 37-like isoform X2 n=1 Tax=Dreissena polymorpha TaxID=45954 RepID=UPI0022652F60|nr:WD repeat-containing protein 37-like isoform X2 [Dreissena polymorpha]
MRSGSIRLRTVKDGVVTSSGEGTAHIWSPQVSISSIDALRAQSSVDDLDMSDQCETNKENPDQPTNLCTPLRELIGHHSVVIAADWLNFGGQVIIASWDRTAILFDAETGANLTVLKGSHV